uniref:Uncharacterized protein n=1 Tax=Arundo donax TaxID=35708 RepID=A0A0A9GGD8_ARUDO
MNRGQQNLKKSRRLVLLLISLSHGF